MSEKPLTVAVDEMGRRLAAQYPLECDALDVADLVGRRLGAWPAGAREQAEIAAFLWQRDRQTDAAVGTSWRGEEAS